MGRKVLVKATVFVEVEVPDDPDYDAEFDIEENHCPGTGIVGSAIEAAMAQGESDRTCWACRLHGENKIVERIDAELKGMAG